MKLTLLRWIVFNVTAHSDKAWNVMQNIRLLNRSTGSLFKAKDPNETQNKG